MSSILFDAPGPHGLRRQRVASAVTVLALLVLGGLAAAKLNAEGQFSVDVWEPFVTPSYLQALLEGAWVTVRVAVVAIVLSIVFGTLFAFGRLSDRVWVRWPATLVVEFFRAVPLLMLILALYLIYGDVLDKFWSLVLGLVLYNGSVLAEVFRAGILAVPHGQSEAAYAVGLRKGQVMRLVLLPQAVRIMLPAIISQSVVALKDTSLGYVLPYEELTKTGQAIAQEFNNYLATALVLAAMFIVVNYALSRLAVWAERRMSRAGVAPVRAREGELVGGGV
ncbi:MAG: amino acid ABC transporter permease [Actinomycetota bacterium]|nr:amino acid ABC transporter permease [Actinomycetota bacterium]